MKTLKLTSMFCLLLVISGCTPQWKKERERINTSNNKLTIPNFEVGKPPIVIENITNLDLSYQNGRIYYKKDNKEYVYKGDYLFEVEP